MKTTKPAPDLFLMNQNPSIFKCHWQVPGGQPQIHDGHNVITKVNEMTYQVAGIIAPNFFQLVFNIRNEYTDGTYEIIPREQYEQNKKGVFLGLAQGGLIWDDLVGSCTFTSGERFKLTFEATNPSGFEFKMGEIEVDRFLKTK